ncbi:hypothetical protein [Nocardioides sp.]|uniref:hypothetical protein n=1 Tax=Nocardioides sp. TaxID=35761 RepID=UPI003510DC8D
MARTVGLAGVAVQLTGATAEAEAELVASLARAVETRAAPELEIAHRPGALRAPDREPDREVHRHRIWTQGSGVLIEGPRGLAHVGAGVAVLDPPPGVVRGVHSLLLPALSELLPGVVVHGGAVGSADGVLLLLGHSGAGKSTAVAGLLAAGGTALADDLVALRRHDGEVQVAALPLPFAVPPTDDLAGVPIEGDPRRRLLVDDVPCASEFRTLSGVVVISHGAAERSTLEAAEGRDVLHLLRCSTMDGVHPATIGGVFAVAAAAAQLPAWRLAHGSDERTRGEDAARLLGGLLTARG